MVSSNPGQALWTGIVDEARGRTVVQRLTADDMWGGWGIRTLSEKERRYNPVGYHLGTIWPHDNSFIASGFQRYGFGNEAANVLDGIVKEGAHFEHHRLPEVFAGYSVNQFQVPVRYPVACHPQAWAAGAVPLMISSLLGITAVAFNGSVRVERPVLPHGVNQLEFRRLKIGRGSVDLRFLRTPGGTVDLEVTNRSGSVHVEVVKTERRPKAA